MTSKPKFMSGICVSSLLLWPLGGVAGLLLSSTGYGEIMQGLRIIGDELHKTGIEVRSINRVIDLIQIVVFPVDIFVVLFGKLMSAVYHK